MDQNLQINQNANWAYHSIRDSIVSAQHRLECGGKFRDGHSLLGKSGNRFIKACGEN